MDTTNHRPQHRWGRHSKKGGAQIPAISKKHASYACLSYVDTQTHPTWVHPGTLLQLNRAPLFPPVPLNAGSAPEAPPLTPTD